MIRPWLRRFCANAGVSSRNGSISSCVCVTLSCSDISMQGLLSRPGNRLCVADAWVYNGVEDICYQVERNYKHRANQEHGQQDRIIPLLKRVEKEFARARPGEDT